MCPALVVLMTDSTTAWIVSASLKREDPPANGLVSRACLTCEVTRLRPGATSTHSRADETSRRAAPTRRSHSSERSSSHSSRTTTIPSMPSLPSTRDFLGSHSHRLRVSHLHRLSSRASPMAHRPDPSSAKRHPSPSHPHLSRPERGPPRHRTIARTAWRRRCRRRN